MNECKNCKNEIIECPYTFMYVPNGQIPSPCPYFKGKDTCMREDVCDNCVQTELNTVAELKISIQKQGLIMKGIKPDYTLIVDGNDTEYYRVTDDFLKSLATPKERVDRGVIFKSELGLLKDKKIVSIDKNGVLHPNVNAKEDGLEMCMFYSLDEKEIIAPLKMGWLVGMISKFTFETDDNLKEYAKELTKNFSRVHLEKGELSKKSIKLERLKIKQAKTERELLLIKKEIESLCREEMSDNCPLTIEEIDDIGGW